MLSILGSESSVRDCENQLMDLFEYEHFPLIRKFVKNRDVVVWCTKLMRSDADEHVNVEVAMWEKGVGWILRELAGDRETQGGCGTEDGYTCTWFGSSTGGDSRPGGDGVQLGRAPDVEQEVQAIRGLV